MQRPYIALVCCSSNPQIQTQVPGGGGAVAVHVMPRYVLHNLLDVPLQCKQAGTAVERELAPGVSVCACFLLAII